jgi:hypothetical protein
MRTFKEYLTESAKTYTFKVKVARDLTTEDESRMRGLLDRFSVAGFNKAGKTPIQSFPLDFPKLKNRDVSIYEVTLEYPTTPFELTEYLSFGLGVTNEELVVRAPGEPTEQYQQPQGEPRTGALLNDPDYKESPNAKFEDYYGDKFNSSLLKELNATMKEQRKARGEQIPGDEQGVTTNTLPLNTKSPVVQAKDPRK